MQDSDPGWWATVFNHIPLLPFGYDSAVKGSGDTWEIVKFRMDGFAHYAQDPSWGFSWVSVGHSTKNTLSTFIPIICSNITSQSSRKCPFLWKFVGLAETRLKVVPLHARWTRMCVKFPLGAHCVSLLHSVKIQTHFHLHFTLSFYWQ